MERCSAPVRLRPHRRLQGGPLRVLDARVLVQPGTPGSSCCPVMHRYGRRWLLFFQDLQIFGGLVLGCIKTKFRKKICVWQHFSSSTRFASFCTAAISKFSQKIGLKKQQFSWHFSKKKLQMSQILQNVAKFAKFQKIQLENLVDFEKCCKARIYLQRSVRIQPKTSEILPNFKNFSLIIW